MKERIKKVVKIIVYITSLFICLVIGTQIERIYQQSLFAQLESVEKIAIVNMDEGVWIGEEHINYADKLIYLPNDDYVTTGLADAKSGIENGTYAAYIILPENFSECINSIAYSPNKISIEYQFNTKLNEQAEVKAINNVYNFIITLNSNVSFVYLDAILAEFHQVQDQSITILNNDMDELQLLTNVEADNLIASANPIDEVKVTNDLATIDLQPYYTNNTSYLVEMENAYKTALNSANEEFAYIQESSIEISTAFSEFFDLYDNYMANMEAEHSKKLKEGKEALYEAIGIYNANINYANMSTEIAEMIEAQRRADEQEAERQMRDTLERLGIDGEQYDINLSICDEATDEKINGMVTSFYNQSLLEADKEKIVNIVEEKLVKVLLDYDMSQKEIFENSRDELFNKMSTYESEVLAFNPMKYVEDANLNQYLSNIEVNTNEMHRLVQANNQEYISYANEVYAATNENNQKLIMALNEANQQTVLNVEMCIGQLAESRINVNGQNVAILENFTKLLPYTRVSTQENTEIYDYIISPISPRKTGLDISQQYSGEIGKEIYLKEIIFFILLIGIISGCLNIIIRLWAHKRKSVSREVE